MSVNEQINNGNLVVVPINGFGNRIRSMASAWILAKQLNRTFYVDWKSCKWYAPEFKRIFCENNKEFRLIDSSSAIPESSNKKVYAGGYKGEQQLMDELCDPNSTEEWMIIKAGGIFKPPAMTWKAYNMLKQTFYTNVLRLQNNHQKIVNDFLKKHNFGEKRVLGIHIRRQDRKHITARTKKYIDEINRLKKKFDLIFVCTDDKTELNHIIKNSRGKCIFYKNSSSHEKESGRETYQQYIDAICDWNILSNCDLILYSKGSSFSYEACIPKKLSNSLEIRDFTKASQKFPPLVF